MKVSITMHDYKHAGSATKSKHNFRDMYILSVLQAAFKRTITGTPLFRLTVLSTKVETPKNKIR